MTTLDDMVNETLTTLQSYGLLQPAMTTLATDIDTDDTAISLSSMPTGAGPGLAEVGTETVLVTGTSNDNGSQATVLRGLRSTAVAHTAGEFITFNPIWPRSMVANALNDAIVGSYPLLYAVADETFNSSFVVNTYDLNALDEKVMAVRTLAVGPTLEWLPITNYRYDGDLKKLTIWDPIVMNRSVKIVTRRRLARINLSDDLTVSGLSSTAKEYVVLQACCKLTAQMDTARLPNAAASPDNYTPFRTVGSATNVSQSLLRLAAMELGRERARLQQVYPPTVKFARRGGFYHQ